MLTPERKAKLQKMIDEALTEGKELQAEFQAEFENLWNRSLKRLAGSNSAEGANNSE